MKRALASEWIKIRSRRTSVLLVLSVALMPPLLAAGVTLVAVQRELPASRWLSSTLTSPNEVLRLVFGMSGLLCALVGALAITSEYRNQTIMRTFQVFPTRTPVLLAKLLVAAGAVAAASAAGALAALVFLRAFGGESLWPESPVLLVLGSVANGLLVSAFGYAVGLLLSRALPTLLTIVAFLFVLPDTLRTVASYLLPGLKGFDQFLPTEASQSLTLAAIPASTLEWLGPATGVMVALAEIVIALVCGVLAQRRRNIT